MRSVILAALIIIAALPAAAQDRFTLDLDTLPLVQPTIEIPKAVPDGNLDLHLTDDQRYALVYRTALTPKNSKEFTLALWNAPMGRLFYSRAEVEAMLGREGLVHGGRMTGLGLATTAVGDGSQSSLSFLASGGTWSELTLGEKFAAGAQASFVAAILYALVSYAD